VLLSKVGWVTLGFGPSVPLFRLASAKQQGLLLGLADSNFWGIY